MWKNPEYFFHCVEKTAKVFPLCGKIAESFSIAWKKRACFSTVWKIFFHSVEKSRKSFPYCGKILCKKYLQYVPTGLLAHETLFRPQRHGNVACVHRTSPERWIKSRSYNGPIGEGEGIQEMPEPPHPFCGKMLPRMKPMPDCRLYKLGMSEDNDIPETFFGLQPLPCGRRPAHEVYK